MNGSSTHLDMVRDEAESFSVPPAAARFVSARILHCRYRSLWGINRLRNLQKLEIVGYPDPSLSPLQGLFRLEHLSIVHLPAVTSLEPLTGLTSLRRLTLATLPAWNPDRKPVEVDSLDPLRTLPALEEVNLFGFRPADRSLKVLWRIPSLRRARLSVYPAGKNLVVELPDRW
jgi:hypothetical protein